jgi:hypothetical protein
MAWGDLLQCCYDYQTQNLKWEGWVISLRNEIHKIGLGYIWLAREGRDLKDICQMIKPRRNNIQKHHIKKKKKKEIPSLILKYSETLLKKFWKFQENPTS